MGQRGPGGSALVPAALADWVVLAARPVRRVPEGAHSHFPSPKAGALGSDPLTQGGAGVGLDTVADDIIVTRTRRAGRMVFGNNVQGAGLGLGINF